MDPCPFVRLIVESLALKLPTVSKPAGPGVHPSTTPCFCTFQLEDHASSTQTAPLPIATPSSSDPSPPASLTETASAISANPVVFSLDPAALQKLSGKPASLVVSVYAGRTGSTCGFSAGRLLGRVRVELSLEAAPARAMVMQSGWVSVGRGCRSAARLHLVVRSEPDPRFVFQFGGEPECSPVVYQIQENGGGHSGCLRQPVFSCRFSADRRRNTRSRSLPSNSSNNSIIKGWFGCLGSERNHRRRDKRKGWTVTIHDLSGSPVAAASMITPFVPSPGSDRVSRSNPGAWLILRATGFSGSTANWKPWGRLEAWRERGPVNTLGYRFELVTDSGPTDRVPIAESSLSVRKGGQFSIDPSVAGDVVSRSEPFVGGFVMGSTVNGEGKVSKPTVQVGLHHVSCMADVALFIALAAAVDLSMDACQLFAKKLRRELCQDQQEYSL
ncbi:uncharacterized protein LOC103711219 [Phoenix dactylifera]|uniref:Uncharacterized protein LOC103711219 n=1 Tax=Phoenix dactylifera TaxID=42345 RepID=A0A8B7CBB3_PHODC|nr:uncharacterized protein LOC103711219 [Phoenix dactylifera]